MVKRYLNKIGFGIALMFLILWYWRFFMREHLQLSDNLNTVIGLAVLYGIGLFVFRMITKPAPAPELQKQKLPAKEFALLFVMQCAAVPVVTILTIVCVVITGKTPDTNTLSLTPFNLFQLLIFAPIMEEFVFRKLFAAKLLPYGERVFILTSALCFSVIHGVSLGVPQIAYTFILGLVWAYVYAKTGSLIYSIVLHALSNLFGSVISQSLMLFSQTAASIYTVLLMLTGIIGFVLFILKRKSISLDGKQKLLDFNVLKTVFGSVGVLFHLGVTLAMIIYKAMLNK